MLAKTLQYLIDAGHTSAREIGEMAGVSTSTVYRWISGQSQPDFDSIRLLVRHLPRREAQEALISAFTAGTPWQFTHQDLELDVNDDGVIDAEDALDASVEAVKTAGETLRRVRAATRGKPLTADEILQVISQLNHVSRQCMIAERVLVELAERRRKRKLKLAE